MSNYDDGLADELDEARGRAAAEAEAARVAALEARLAAVTEAARAVVAQFKRCDMHRLNGNPCTGIAVVCSWGDDLLRCREHARAGDRHLDTPAEVQALAALLGEPKVS